MNIENVLKKYKVTLSTFSGKNYMYWDESLKEYIIRSKQDYQNKIIETTKDFNKALECFKDNMK